MTAILVGVPTLLATVYQIWLQWPASPSFRIADAPAEWVFAVLSRAGFLHDPVFWLKILILTVVLNRLSDLVRSMFRDSDRMQHYGTVTAQLGSIHVDLLPLHELVDVARSVERSVDGLRWSSVAKPNDQNSAVLLTEIRDELRTVRRALESTR